MPYPIEKVIIGYVAHEEVVGIHVPRDTFVAWVQEVLDAGESRYEAIADDMLATARKMPRFPLGEWMHPTRGCGCVVGEYLVAADLIGRAKRVGISHVIREAKPDEADDLITFGMRVDDHVKLRLSEDGSFFKAEEASRDDDDYTVLDVVVLIDD